MHNFFHHLRDHDGVAHCSVARAHGITWHREQRLVANGILDRPASRVVRCTAVASTWRQRCRIATLAPGRGVISHGAAARLHGLDGFADHQPVDLLCHKGAWPGRPGEVITHFSRGLTDADVVEVDGIPVLSVPATLALLAPHGGAGPTSRAVVSALRAGWTVDELRAGAVRWRRRGRPGPGALLHALDAVGQASTPSSISSAADHGSTVRPTTDSVSSSQRSPVHN